MKWIRKTARWRSEDQDIYETFEAASVDLSTASDGCNVVFLYDVDGFIIGVLPIADGIVQENVAWK